MNDDVLSMEIVGMVKAKNELAKSISDLMASRDRQRLIETVIENAVYDIQFARKFDCTIEPESTKPLDEHSAEMLKRMLFDIAGIGDSNV